MAHQTPLDELVTDVHSIERFIERQKRVVTDGALESMLDAQSNVIRRRILALTRITADQGADLTDLIHDGPWTDSQKAAMNTAVNQVVDTGAVQVNHRRSNQNIKTFQNYWNQARYSIMQSEDISSLSKIQEGADLCVDITLGNPAEKSVGHIVAVLLMLGVQDPGTPAGRHNLVKDFKRALRLSSNRRAFPPAAQQIVNFPDSARGLPEHITQHAYGTDGLNDLVEMDLNLDTLTNFEELIPLRATRRNLRTAYAENTDIHAFQHPPSQPGAAGMMEAMIRTMVQTMQSSMQNNDNMRRPRAAGAGHVNLTFGNHRGNEQLALPDGDGHDDGYGMRRSRGASLEMIQDRPTGAVQAEALRRADTLPQMEDEDARNAAAAAQAEADRRAAAAVKAKADCRAAADVKEEPVPPMSPSSQVKLLKDAMSASAAERKKEPARRITGKASAAAKSKASDVIKTVTKDSAVKKSSGKPVDPTWKASQERKNAVTKQAYDKFMEKMLTAKKAARKIPSQSEKNKLLPGGCPKCRFSSPCPDSCWSYRLKLK